MEKNCAWLNEHINLLKQFAKYDINKYSIKRVSSIFVVLIFLCIDQILFILWKYISNSFTLKIGMNISGLKETSDQIGFISVEDRLTFVVELWQQRSNFASPFRKRPFHQFFQGLLGSNIEPASVSRCYHCNYFNFKVSAVAWTLINWYDLTRSAADHFIYQLSVTFLHRMQLFNLVLCTWIYFVMLGPIWVLLSSWPPIPLEYSENLLNGRNYGPNFFPSKFYSVVSYSDQRIIYL